MVSSGEQLCLRFDAEGQKRNKGTHLDPSSMDREFMKALAEADPEMAKNAYAMQTMLGTFKSLLKKGRGESLSVAERADILHKLRWVPRLIDPAGIVAPSKRPFWRHTACERHRGVPDTVPLWSTIGQYRTKGQ